MPNCLEERNLRLTEEEALCLLEITMTCPTDLSVEQRTAVVKLGEFCRQFMRTDQQDTLNLAVDRQDAPRPTACAA